MLWPVREAPPKSGTFFRLQVYERVEISLVKVYERVGRSVMYFGLYNDLKGSRRIYFIAVKKLRKYLVL